MTLKELAHSGVLPQSSVFFILCKPLFGRYVQSAAYTWSDMRNYLLEPSKSKRPFPWAQDEVSEIMPDGSGNIIIKLGGDIGDENKGK